jgi:hypothetical protein
MLSLADARKKFKNLHPRCNVFEINKVFIIKNENQAGFDSQLGITARAHPHGSEIIPVAAACAHVPPLRVFCGCIYAKRGR